MARTRGMGEGGAGAVVGRNSGWWAVGGTIINLCFHGMAYKFQGNYNYLEVHSLFDRHSVVEHDLCKSMC